jgi:hypothetical protein
LEHPVQDKRQLLRLFFTAVLLSMLLYILVGSIVSAYFGAASQQSSNLNWERYCGPGDGFLAFFVVIFPALDVASAFPLNAYTLGNTLMAAFFPHGQDQDNGYEHGQEGKRRSRLRLCRGLAASLPLLGALVDRNLGHITDYTGLVAFALAFIFPPLLAHYSQQKLQALGVSHRSLHSSALSGPGFQLLLLASGLASMLFVGVALIREDSTR